MTEHTKRILYEIYHGRLFQDKTHRLYLYAESHQGWSGQLADWLGDFLDGLGVLWTRVRA